MVVSRTYLMIANLRWAADEHKARCAGSCTCNVSLALLQQTASLLADSLGAVEMREVREKYLDGWPR